MCHSDAVTSPLRRRQREEVRRAIDAAALALFTEHGYADVTTDQVAAAAGVSPSTYYRHVPAKEDLLLRPVWASSAAIVERYRDTATSTPAGPDPETDLITAIRDQTRSMTDTAPARWRSVIASVPEVLDRVGLIAETDRAQLIAITADRLGVTDPDDLRPGVLVAAVLAVVEYGYRRWMTSTDARPLLEYIDAALAAR